MMKKFLLMMVAIMAILSLSAQENEGGWLKSFEPVKDATDMGNVCVAQAPDGSVYVATTQNKDFTFAGKDAKSGEVGTVIVKYDKDGEEQWSSWLWGSVIITAMTTDSDGKLYVAGEFIGNVDVELVGGALALLQSEGAFSCFVGKLNKDEGGFEGVMPFMPTPDTSVTENWEADYYYISLVDELYIYPQNIQIDGSKVYVSALYIGDVEAFGWKGAYAQNEGMAFDVQSYGVFSLDKASLGNPQSVATLRQTGEVSENMSQPEAFNFAVEGGALFVGFFAYGDVTLTTPEGTRNFSYARANDVTGARQHALVLAMSLPSPISTFAAKEYPTKTMHTKETIGIYQILRPVAQNGKVYMAGSFYGEFPLDADINNDCQTVFMVSYDLKEVVDDWIVTTDAEEGNVQPVAMVVTGDEVHLATDKNVLTIGTEDGDVKVEDLILADADAYNDEYAVMVMVDDTKVYVKSMDMSGDGNAIDDVLPATVQTSGVLFNLMGQPIDESYKGIAITADGKKVLIK